MHLEGSSTRKDTRPRTPDIALQFNSLEGSKNGEGIMARPERFELPTLRFEA